MASPPQPRAERSVLELLAEAADLARYAPSVLNTQPWHWRVSADRLDLWADRRRQLLFTDPHGQFLLLSCGAALHHAVTVLNAAGYAAVVRRHPDPRDPDLLARVTLGQPRPPRPVEQAWRAAITVRRTDRRAVDSTPLTMADLAPLRSAVEEQGNHLHLVRTDQMPMLAIAAGRAAEIELSDPAYLIELSRWVDRPEASGDGVPAAATASAGARRVPVRDFALGVRAGIAVDERGDRGASYAVLFGPGDDAAAWLRAGEALSALLLTAATAGIAAAPMSDLIEVPAARDLVRGLLSGLGEPYLVLRLGRPEQPRTPPPSSPRRAASDVISYDR